MVERGQSIWQSYREEEGLVLAGGWDRGIYNSLGDSEMNISAPENHWAPKEMSVWVLCFFRIINTPGIAYCHHPLFDKN